MQHTFEFIAQLRDGRTFHMYYKGKTCRHMKVRVKIAKDLERVYGINPFEIKDILLREEKHI